MKDCSAELKEHLVEVAGGRAVPVVEARLTAHAVDCAECAAELELLRALAVGRPSIPPELAARIDREVGAGLAERPAAGGRSSRVPLWALAAAALAVLALGTPSMMERVGLRSTSPDVALDADDGVGVWITDGPLVAGAPVLEGLSDEQLNALLEELGG